MPKLNKRIERRAHLVFKNIYQRLLVPKQSEKDILFILGCQRSGTTMILNIFDKDYSVKVYREVSKLSSLDSKTGRRLNPLGNVEKEINRNRVSTVVAKPLVEIQNIDKLLDYFDKSKALWVYRNHKDVISSDLKSFGIQNGINNIRAIYDKSEDNWRSERASESTINIIHKYFSEDMSPYDAAALAWYSRNILFFERKLDSNSRVHICKYEDFVRSPEKILKQIYSFAGAEFPKQKMVSDVHPRSIGKGDTIVLSPPIEHLCQELLEKMDRAYVKRKN